MGVATSFRRDFLLHKTDELMVLYILEIFQGPTVLIIQTVNNNHLFTVLMPTVYQICLLKLGYLPME